MRSGTRGGKGRVRWLGIAALLTLLLAGPGSSRTLAACPPHDDLVERGAWLLAARDGRILAACNADAPLVPASILKLATALAAFDILGADFRFTTRFYTDPDNTLYIQGAGDPFLVSEEVSEVAHRLRQAGLSRVRDIVIDSSAYALESQTPGRGESTRPYDAPVGAVSVNFNTVQVIVDSKGQAHSAEEQTPALPLMGELARGLKPGRYSINVCAGACDPEQRMARYTAELFRALLGRAGISGSGSWRLGKAPDNARLLYSHQSRQDLRWLVDNFVRYSSNFMANAVFLACGVQASGGPATWDKARQAVAASLRRILGEKAMVDLHMVEGAGLSRDNRVSARTMLAILQRFAPYAESLKTRQAVRLKSGTLTGVYNYAGYLPDGRPFVIMLNQQRNTRDSLLDRLAATPLQQ